MAVHAWTGHNIVLASVIVHDQAGAIPGLKAAARASKVASLVASLEMSVEIAIGWETALTHKAEQIVAVIVPEMFSQFLSTK